MFKTKQRSRLSEELGMDLYFKKEFMQYTGRYNIVFKFLLLFKNKAFCEILVSFTLFK